MSSISLNYYRKRFLNNINMFDKICGKIKYAKYLVDIIISCHKTFKNPSLVIKNIRNANYPFDCVLKDGRNLTIQSFAQFFVVLKASESFPIQYDLEKGLR